MSNPKKGPEQKGGERVCKGDSGRENPMAIKKGIYQSNLACRVTELVAGEQRRKAELR